jgi:uncharacterized protein
VAASTAGEAALPRLSGRIVDEARLLSPEQAATLGQRLADVEARTSHQFVVVTVRSLSGESIDSFGRRLGNAWGIGRKDVNDGVLLIVAPSERRVRIEVGYGLETALTNAEADAIIQHDILPRFREGAMADGIDAGATAIIREISQ